ncbi:MAG: enoyl-CoA hydratase/isomerase family protein [Terriglobia bacterium]|jgi:enoyl-CoA hydratase/carnithine racemase
MELSSHNSVAVLAFSPTEGYPRLTSVVLGELDDLLEEVKGGGLFNAVVIAANAKSFVTGAEIAEVAAVAGLRAREFAERGQSTCHRVAAFPLPVVAAIRGYCLGGGLDLALACHGRVATYEASFGYPGAALGLLTGWGGTGRLPDLLGKTTAMEMFLTADRIPATQAMTMGLIDELASSRDLISTAAQRAQALRGVPMARNTVGR